MPPKDPYNDEILCPLCERSHSIRKCRRFLTLPVKDKLEIVFNENICKNCLSVSQRSARCCPCEEVCLKCQKDHHTILHYEPKALEVVMEMTAMVYVAETEDEKGTFWRIKLNPSQRYSTVAAWSIYNFASIARCTEYPETLSIYMWSRFPDGEDRKVQIDLRVEDQPMHNTPLVALKRKNILKRVNKWNMADPYFWRPDYAPITLGAVAPRKIYIGPPKTTPLLPMSQCTIFGWTFFGNIKTEDIEDTNMNLVFS